MSFNRDKKKRSHKKQSNQSSRKSHKSTSKKSFIESLRGKSHHKKKPKQPTKPELHPHHLAPDEDTNYYDNDLNTEVDFMAKEEDYLSDEEKRLSIDDPGTNPYFDVPEEDEAIFQPSSSSSVNLPEIVNTLPTGYDLRLISVPTFDDFDLRKSVPKPLILVSKGPLLIRSEADLSYKLCTKNAAGKWTTTDIAQGSLTIPPEWTPKWQLNGMVQVSDKEEIFNQLNDHLSSADTKPVVVTSEVPAPKPPFYKRYPKITGALVLVGLSFAAIGIAGAIVAAGPAGPALAATMGVFGSQIVGVLGPTIAATLAPFVVPIGSAVAGVLVAAGSMIVGAMAGAALKLFNQRMTKRTIKINPATDFEKYKDLLIPLLKDRKMGEKIKRRNEAGKDIIYQERKLDWKGRMVYGRKFKLSHSIIVGEIEKQRTAGENAEGEIEKEKAYYVMPGKNKGNLGAGGSGYAKRTLGLLQLRQNNQQGEVLEKNADDWVIKKSKNPEKKGEFIKEVAAAKALAIENYDLGSNSLMVKKSGKYTSENQYSFFMRDAGNILSYDLLPKNPVARTAKVINIYQNTIYQFRKIEEKGFFNSDIKTSNLAYNEKTNRTMAIDLGSILPFANIKEIYGKIGKTAAYYPPEHFYNIEEHRPVSEKETPSSEKVTAYQLGMSLVILLTNGEILGEARQYPEHRNHHISYLEPFNITALLELKKTKQILNDELIDLTRMMINFNEAHRPDLETCLTIINAIAAGNTEAARAELEKAGFNEAKLVEDEKTAAEAWEWYKEKRTMKNSPDDGGSNKNTITNTV